jgi:hypothetical protein
MLIATVDMQFLRRRLSWIVGAWLICQLASGGVAAALLAAGPFAELCTCPGGMPGQICPMHSGHQDDTRGDSGCAIGNMSVTPDASLTSLLGNIGVVPARRSFAVGPTITAVQAHHVPAPLNRPDIPEPPPPRT